MGLNFIGVVKTATRGFPMKALSELEMSTRGQWNGLLSLDADGNSSLLAFCWLDRDRRYFVSTCSSLAPGAPYSRNRWRQLEDVASNMLPELVELVVPQPIACELYYDTCAQADKYNRCRQDDLDLEKKIGTHDWAKKEWGRHSSAWQSLTPTWRTRGARAMHQ